jgi:hypothetical protein
MAVHFKINLINYIKVMVTFDVINSDREWHLTF